MRFTAFFVFLLTAFTVSGQVKAPAPYGVLPSARQLKWHEVEMYVIVHFTPTTFENKEWGYGDAAPESFNPTAFDAGQIVGAVKDGGFKGVIFVSKHHDGFCLWPTSTTPYNISKSKWRNGKGDMVREFEKASRDRGMQFGVYCSPWDRNNPQYGSYEYVKTYRAQLKELYTRYGSLFMSWHDGANGGDGYYGGTRETRKIDRTTYYGWDTTWAMTRKLQPMANIFSDVGWDVRWVGNEKGEAAPTSWATFTPTPLEGKAKAGPGEVRDDLSPEGTRNGKYWIPAECDVPLRNGWFYHPEQDSTVKSPEKLFDLYLKSVGRGANLDLGVSPDTRGILHEKDVASLKAFGDMLKATFRNDLSKTAKIKASNTRGGDATRFGAQQLTDGNRYSYWASDDKITTPSVELEWKTPQQFNLVRLRENIKLGQRIEKVELDAWLNGAWEKISEATSIGSCRLILLDKPIETTKLRLRIVQSPVAVALSEFNVFLKPR
jgi:alpha-L-fucosidase